MPDDPSPPSGDDDDDLVGAPDASTVVTPDAAPSSDAEPEPLAYPSGPYGTSEGAVIENLSWMGYRDDDGDGDPFDDAVRAIDLDEFFVGRDPDARILLVNASAGWCGACQEEAPLLRGLYREYEGRGVHIMTAVFETTGGAPAGLDFARSWGTSFDLPFTTVADPTDRLGPYYHESAVPMNMFIDLQTMRIIDIYHGFDSSYTREILDAYAR